MTGGAFDYRSGSYSAPGQDEQRSASSKPSQQTMKRSASGPELVQERSMDVDLIMARQPSRQQHPGNGSGDVGKPDDSIASVAGGSNGSPAPRRQTPSKRPRLSSPHGAGAGPAANSATDENTSKKRAPKKAVSCEACRRRKLKCDRGWPCGACQDRNESSLCEWADGVQPQYSGRDAVVAGAVSDRLDRLEAMMGSIANHLGVSLPGQGASRERTGPEEDGPPSLAAAAAAGDGSSHRGTLAGSARPASDAPAGNAVDRGSTGKQFESIYMVDMPGIALDNVEGNAAATLSKLVPLLPDAAMVRALCKNYVNDLGTTLYVIDETDLMRQLRRFEAFRARWNDGDRSFPHTKLREEVRFLALLFALCAAITIFGESPESAALEARYGGAPYTVMIPATQHALGAAEIYEHLDIINVRTMLVTHMAITTLKGPKLGRVAATKTFALASLMNLDTEPPTDLPEAVRKDRILLFATLCTADWMPCGTSKRLCFFDESYLEYPSLFDATLDRNNYMRPEPKTMLAIARLSLRASSRVLMQEDAAYRYTETLQSELHAIEAGLPPRLRYEGPHTLGPVEDPEVNFRLWSALMVQRTLMTLHKHFYIQSWTQPRYKRSRSICFAAASATVRLCRDAFFWFHPRDDSTPEERQALILEGLKKRHSSVSKVWHVVQMALISSLVLVHCLSMLELHPEESAGWHLPTLRADVSDDLKFMRTVVQALSPKLESLKESMKALDPLTSLDKTSKILSSDRPRLEPPGAASPLSTPSARASRGTPSHVPLPGLRSRADDGHGPSPPNGSMPQGFEERSRRRPPPHNVAFASSVKNFDDLEALWNKQPWSTTWSDQRAAAASSSSSSAAPLSRPRTEATISNASSPSASSVGRHTAATPPTSTMPPPSTRSPHPSFGPGSHLLNDAPTGFSPSPGPSTRPETGPPPLPRPGPQLAPIQSPPMWGPAPPLPPAPALPPTSGMALYPGTYAAPLPHAPQSFATGNPSTSASSTLTDWTDVDGVEGAAADGSGGGGETASWLNDVAKLEFSKADTTFLEHLVPYNPLTNMLVESLDGFVQNLDQQTSMLSSSGAAQGRAAHEEQQRVLSGHNTLLSMAEAMRMDSYM
ncbi:uncharacterized protein PFL1_02787 [Pseudozyma flocculosa PF-1]|uniref:Zn(2)-C6 fungal-type domain-containing protein n=2 Tax=Pseudozyma flocculosa TaxID=84751 RepID=A0A5C3F291_9BASI|nr:uncharacterized protein PFL1_02787 [Pseudozyma flocculosa PF-1]EPQ29568.1 hypothetical protein PFL1_02787 [Pseudozyma flocculosa PF-1]SPO38115.1 uncharacterized protein PSFLO_03592 [Pseudozyma flocculosa]